MEGASLTAARGAGTIDLLGRRGDDSVMQDPVVVVGGGIGGLTTALALAQRGIECEVYERAPELNEIGAGVQLWPMALRALDRVGVGTEVRALGGAPTDFEVRWRDGRRVMHLQADRLSERIGEAPIAVHRGELQGALLRAVGAGVVTTGKEVVGVAPTTDGAVVRFADETERRAKAVIAADGRHSVVRSTMWGRPRLHRCRVMGWRGTATTPPGLEDQVVAGITWGEGMEFGMLRIAGDRTTWFGVVRRFDDGGSKAELLRRFARFHSPVPELLEATPEEAIWRDDIDDLWPLRRWSKGPVALLGDAAHAMTPAFGVGACHAILDAEAVAAALATDAEPERAFRAYQRARQRRVRAVTMVARAGVAGPRRDRPQRLAAAGLGVVPNAVFLAGLAAVTAG